MLSSPNQRNPWRVVLASAIGLGLGQPALLIFTLGVFTKPIEHDLGWSREQISVAVAVFTIVSVIVAPLHGHYILDKFGPRKTTLASLPIFAIGVASLYFTPHDRRVFYLTWALITALAWGVAQTTFNKAVASWFDDRLGLALGAAVTGQGIGAAVLPVVAQGLIGHYGWRLAYVGLAAISFAAISTSSYLFLHDREHARRDDPVATDGLTLREATRGGSFWLIAAAFLFLGVVTAGMMTHQVPMLVDAGMKPTKAAGVQALFGVSIVVGRITVGALLDRFFAPRVLIASLVGIVFGLASYARGGFGDAAFFSAVTIGFAFGAEMDVLGFLITRYFGRRAFGNVYGAIFAIFQIGAAVGAVMLGAVRTKTGSYSLALWVLVGCTVVAMGCLSRVGPYRAARLAD